MDEEYMSAQATYSTDHKLGTAELWTIYTVTLEAWPEADGWIVEWSGTRQQREGDSTVYGTVDGWMEADREWQAERPTQRELQRIAEDTLATMLEESGITQERENGAA